MSGLPKHELLEVLRYLKVDVVKSSKVPVGHAKVITRADVKMSPIVHAKRIEEMNAKKRLRRKEILGEVGTVISAVDIARSVTGRLRGLYEIAKDWSKTSSIDFSTALKDVTLRRIQGRDVFGYDRAVTMTETHSLLKSARLRFQLRLGLGVNGSRKTVGVSDGKGGSNGDSVGDGKVGGSGSGTGVSDGKGGSSGGRSNGYGGKGEGGSSNGYGGQGKGGSNVDCVGEGKRGAHADIGITGGGKSRNDADTGAGSLWETLQEILKGMF